MSEGILGGSGILGGGGTLVASGIPVGCAIPLANVGHAGSEAPNLEMACLGWT